MTLLLVDDVEFIRTILVPFLSARLPFVHIVGEASSMQQALEVADTTQFDMVILDIHLPGGGGFELLRRLKALSRPPIVIVFTHCAARDYHITCLEAGADFFFEKGYEDEILEDVLQGLRQLSDKHLFVGRRCHATDRFDRGYIGAPLQLDAS